MIDLKQLAANYKKATRGTKVAYAALFLGFATLFTWASAYTAILGALALLLCLRAAADK